MTNLTDEMHDRAAPMPQPSAADAKRDEVVARAAELFDQAGYHGASMTRTARAVGLSKAALYHYFSSKEQILFEIHERFIGDLLAKAQERAGTITPTEELTESIRDVVRLLRTHPGHVRVFLEHHRELSEQDQRAIQEKRARYRELIEDTVRRGIEAGEFRPLDPGMVTQAVFGVCAWTHQWYDPARSPATDEIASFYVDLLLGGLRAPDGA